MQQLAHQLEHAYARRITLCSFCYCKVAYGQLGILFSATELKLRIHWLTYNKVYPHLGRCSSKEIAIK